nr:MAG TPA: hypothetical protein [Caudoviricetes sp.]
MSILCNLHSFASKLAHLKETLKCVKRCRFYVIYIVLHQITEN